MEITEIMDPAIREAAGRFERETGRRITDACPVRPNEEALLELFLIVEGYPCSEADQLRQALGAIVIPSKPSA